MNRPFQLFRKFLSAVSLIVIFAITNTVFIESAHVLSASRPALPAHAAHKPVTAEFIIDKLLAANRQREARLQKYSVPGTYRVRNEQGKVSAETQVLLQYRAPGIKEFKIVAEKGSGFIQSRVFKPLMEVEVETATGRKRYESSVTPDNYSFSLLGEEDLAGVHCYIMQATPRRTDKYLFRGKVWIHAAEFAIVQVAGQPARNPSIFIKRVDFVRYYQKVSGFWLPRKSESVTQVRMLGKNTLTIDYDRYEITQSGAANM